MNYQIRILWVIDLEMHSIIMPTVHTGMHHENAGINGCTFAGFECHRTDGQFGRSAPLQNFDDGFLFETQHAITIVGDFNREGFIVAKRNIAIVDFLRVNSDHRRSAATTVLIGK